MFQKNDVVIINENNGEKRLGVIVSGRTFKLHSKTMIVVGTTGDHGLIPEQSNWNNWGTRFDIEKLTKIGVLKG